MSNISDYFPSNINLSVAMPSIPVPTMLNSIAMPSIPSLVTSAMNAVGGQSLPQRKTWQQMRDSVRNAHRRLHEVSSKLPFAINIRNLSDSMHDDNGTQKIRIYFLSCLMNSPETTLLYCDVIKNEHGVIKEMNSKRELRAFQFENLIKGEEQVEKMDISTPGDENDRSNSRSNEAEFPVFEWHELINSSSMIRKPRDIELDRDPNSDAKESSANREEKLLLERKRMKFTGITSYELHAESGRIVFSSGGSLFYFDDEVDKNKIPPVSSSTKEKTTSTTSDSSTVINDETLFSPILPDIKQPVRLECASKGVKLNPTICPNDTNLIAYVCDGDIYVMNVFTGKEIRLTNAKFDDTSKVVSAGLPSYIAQEEFSRYIGFWWRPSSNEQTDDDDEQQYEILFEEVDETDVEVIKLPCFDGNSEEYRFPKPGCQNATSKLKLVSFKHNTKTGELSQTSVYDLPNLPSFNSVYSSTEYLVRVGWYSRDAIWFQLLNRKQDFTALCLISVTGAFPPQVIHTEDASPYWYNLSDSLHFFNTKKREFLKPGDDLTFLWLSEKTGFRHIYLITVQLVSSNDDLNQEKIEVDEKNVTSNDETKSNADNVNLKSKFISETQLTCGNWIVVDSVWVDEENDLVYFVSLKESPLEKHLYVMSLKEKMNKGMKRLTDAGYSHTTIIFDSKLSMFINIQSNISIPPFGFLNELKFKQSSGDETKNENKSNNQTTADDQSNHLLPSCEKLGSFLTNLIGSHLPGKAEVKLNILSSMQPMVTKINTSLTNTITTTIAAIKKDFNSSSASSTNASPPKNNLENNQTNVDQIDLLPGLSKPEIFTYQLKGSGDIVYGLIFKPEFMESGVKYPCILDVYGGPGFQIVQNAFKHVRLVRRHMLSSEGFVVCAFDCRGSINRGKAFEYHLQNRMGQVEIADQVEVLQWLAENTGYIDMNRVAIHGWSYGGYLALMGIAQRPDIFKLCIAGAPVTNWGLYDTGYTERYMGTPQTNPDGYAKGSVLHYVNQFPSEENRVLIVHGLLDENVHFYHTLQLIQALIKAGKPYNLQIYPTERHSLPNSSACEHFETFRLSYLHQHL